MAADRQRAVPGPVRAAGRRSWPARRPTRASSGSSASTTSWPAATRARCSPPTATAAEVLGVATRGRRRRPARRRDRPGLRVHPGGRQPRPAAGVRQEGHPRRLHRLGRLRRGGGGGPGGPGRARGPGRRAGHPARRAQRPGRRVDAGRRCAPRSSAPYPPAGPHRHRQPVGQLRQLVRELRRSSPASASAGPCRPATPPPSACPTTSSTSPTTPRPPWRSPTSRASATAGPSPSGCGGVAERMPVVVVKGGATAGGQRAAASHTGALASDDRVFDGAVPPGRRDPGRHGRGGASRSRPPSPPSRCRGATGSWSSPPRAAGAWSTADAIAGTDLELAAAARRPAGRDRRPAAAPLEPQQPRRPGRRRDPRHHPRGPASWSAAHPDVDAVLFLGHRHPVQPGPARCGRARSSPTTASSASSRYHERQDARYAEAAAEVSEATGKPVLVATELAVDLARQPRPGRRPGHRPALLPVGQPGGRRPRPPVAPVALARPPRPRLTDRPATWPAGRARWPA